MTGGQQVLGASASRKDFIYRTTVLVRKDQDNKAGEAKGRTQCCDEKTHQEA